MNVEGAATSATAREVVAFWHTAGPKKWFAKNDAFDKEIRTRFLSLYEQAAAGELSDWESSPVGALALLILLDQFPRNMFRNDARAFVADELARGIADRAIERGFDQHASVDDRVFFYLPFEHSEAMEDQERCLALMRGLGNDDLLKWAQLHADIIRRFGRFPHRNAVLGRDSTPEEKAFLDAGGFSG
ncbi:MAG: DUF924 domain-containing protein [Rhizobiales bacterium]|nr:DUF924 domain-containing protein [Hyphomicrobiales bacterium]